VPEDPPPLLVKKVETALQSVTSRIPHAEKRASQVEMADLITSAINTREPVIIEAGTGIGKSLAYLVPVVLSGRRAVIATATKALQDQLITKEVPSLLSAGIPVEASVLKGRLNYLCQKKHEEVKAAPGQMFTDLRDVVALNQITTWAKTTVSGERDELTVEPSPALWSALSMSADECPGKEVCPFGSTCFAERAKTQAAASQVVIVNSALYGAHLATGMTLLPDHDVVVFDEAHELPDILSRSLGAELSSIRLRALAAVVRSLNSQHVNPSIDALHRLADELHNSLLARVETINESPVGVDPRTNEVLVELETALGTLLAVLETLTSSDELTRISVRGVASHLRADLSRFLVPERQEIIFVEGSLRPVIVVAPVEVGGYLEGLWEKVTPVLTSATIPEDLASRLGLSTQTHELPSPFDYKKNALLYVPKHLPDRRDPACEDEITLELIRLITAAGGRTLSLFTSRRALELIGAQVRAKVETPVLIQGEAPRSTLLSQFERDEATSLFATMGFWQGVDVPGRTLSLLTIDRLPFGRPNDPMLEARRELVGSRAFYAVDLPRTSMLLAQGVGRLIRNASDRGVVAVFDTRLATASYRGVLLDRLPPMGRTTSLEATVAFLAAATTTT
jgi:ATP-dependent DNA helicase DinG